MEKRIEKQFWATTNQNSVKYVTGYGTQHSDVWWVPTLGYSMTEKYSLFLSEEAAKAKVRSDIAKKQLELQ